MKNLFLTYLFFFSTINLAFNQSDTLKNDSVDVFESIDFLAIVENALTEYYREVKTDNRTDSIIKSLGYLEEDVPEFSDSVYCERIALMNELNPFHLDCNEAVLSTIHYFAKKRRMFTSITLGRAGLYFDMYEEKLAKHDMPLELKYLSVIESGLRPQVKSRAGALGLWQFMYRTGKMYGLNQNSYIDERMDPEKATEAACVYLKKLHSMYDDWNMALAAYNAGPGNVNKAIRRSGGKMTYWEIRPYLPRETRGYVPNFIAMSYMMTYHAEHNIHPTAPVFYDFELDTVCLKEGVHMETIDSLFGWSIEDIKLVNPIYTTSYIPKTNPPQCISMPIPLVKEWISLEDSLYILDSIYFSLPSDEELNTIKTSKPSGQSKVHTVRSGESLSVIAGKYGTTVSKLMDWNNLHSTRLRVGQKLNVYGAKQTEKTPEKEAAPQPIPDDKAHVIQSGESLWAVSKKYGTTVDELRKLNPGVNESDLKVGQKIRVK